MRNSFCYNQLFLGKGFLWKTQHTQRLRDLDLLGHAQYKTDTKKSFFQSLPFLNPNKNNHASKILSLGGNPALHGIADFEQTIFMPLVDRGNHMVVIGLTGMGKTRFAEILISQDIKRGDVVIVLDPKGDADLLKRIYREAKTHGRAHDFLALHLGAPQYSCRYNAIGDFSRITEVAKRITNSLPGEGEAASFKAFAWQYVHLIASVLFALNETPTFQSIKYYLNEREALMLQYCDRLLLPNHTEFEHWCTEFTASRAHFKNAPTRMHAWPQFISEKGLAKNNPLLASLQHASELETDFYLKLLPVLDQYLRN